MGKSTLIGKVRPNARQFDLENVRHRELIEEDVEFFLKQNPPPLCLDEAQLSDVLFQGLRVAIDENRNQPGQYLISGSSSPRLLGNIGETLAGRVAVFELSGFSLEEAFALPPSPLYQYLFDGKLDQIGELEVRLSRDQVLDLCFNGGYPEHFLQREDLVFHDQWMDNYIRSYIERDIRALFPNLKLEAYQRFIRMLAVSSSQLVNASLIAKSLDVSQPTVRNYIDIAAGTFLWRKLPPFASNQRKRLTKMPKGHFRDSGLLCRLLGIHEPEALLDHPHYGAVWEGFVSEQIIRGLSYCLRSFDYYHYRTQHQAEIDLVLEGPFGLIPIEIKTGYRISRQQLRHLKSFIQENNCPLGLVVNNGESVEKIAEKIVQVPIGCL